MICGPDEKFWFEPFEDEKQGFIICFYTRKRESLHMTKLHRKCLLVAGVVGLTLQSAYAQNGGGPVGPIVGFDIVDASVPLGSWVAVGLTLVISAMAVWGLRGRRRLASVVVALGALAAGGGLLGHAPSAEAVLMCPTETLMVTSPTTATFCGAKGYTFVNNAGRSIIIRSVTLSQPGSFAITAPLTTCQVGSALPSGATCSVQVDAIPS